MSYQMYKPIKDLGQNFLTDFTVARLMVNSLDLKSEDLVVEIGAGPGILTEVLSDTTLNKNIIVHAIEIDERFVGKLNRMFLENLDLNVVHADILEWLSKFSPQKPFKVLGSLPYYITSPIIHAIVKHPGEIETAVLLMQKEVARKVLDEAPEASYLSVFVHAFFDVQFIKVVPKGTFNPVPKVDGGILKLTAKKEPLIKKEDVAKFEGFLHKGFSKPRKMLNKPFQKDVLAKVGIDEKLRPQHVITEKWVELFYIMKNS